MKIKSMTGVLLAAAVLGSLAGCMAKPVSVVEVDQSVLPAAAKSLLPQEATINRAEKETYGDGNEIYVLHYTLNGVDKAIKVNAKDHTSASGVFDTKK